MNEISEIIHILNRIASPDSRKETLYLCNRLRKINQLQHRIWSGFDKI